MVIEGHFKMGQITQAKNMSGVNCKIYIHHDFLVVVHCLENGEVERDNFC